MCALCALGGLGVLVLGILILLPSIQFAAGATESASGRVVCHDQEGQGADLWYYPRVAFTAGGREWECRGQCGWSRPTPPVGARVRVYFPPADPGAAQLSRFGGVKVAALMLACGGGLVVLAIRAAWSS